MRPSVRDNALGMQRAISRRDFLNGVAVGAGMALADFPLPAAGPPAAGFRGQTDQGFAIMHALRDGRFWANAGPAEALDEHYDLIVVGAGISGLASAFLYRQQAGPGARILLLENSGDFGGHAVRNEFTASNGRRIIGYGGSKSLQTPSFFSPAVSKFMADVGIDVGKFDKWYDRRWAADRGLGPAVFFNRETFGADGLFRTDGKADEWIARTPLDEKAKSDLVKLLSAPADPFKGKSRAEKFALLSQTTYEAFLLQILGLHPQAAAYLADTTKSYFGVGAEAVTCLDARAMRRSRFRRHGSGRRRPPDAQSEREIDAEESRPVHPPFSGWQRLFGQSDPASPPSGCAAGRVDRGSVAGAGGLQPARSRG